jgi:hypothetical protein
LSSHPNRHILHLHFWQLIDMRGESLLLVGSLGHLASATPYWNEKRLNNGLGKTPALGWNSWVSAVTPRLQRCSSWS